MSSPYSAVLLLSLANLGLAGNNSSTCAIGNSACVNNLMNTIFSEVVRGDPKLNMSACDPLRVPVMTRKMAMYTYNKTNNFFRGFKRCSISSVQLSSDMYMMKFIMSCPSYNVAGNVDVLGYLLYEYVFGQGSYNISCAACTVHTYIKLDLISNNKEKYLQMGEFSVYVAQQPNCTFSFSNLFGGNKKRTEAAAVFATENSMEVMSFEDLDNMFKPAMSSFFVEMNKKLATMPVDKLFTL